MATSGGEESDVTSFSWRDQGVLSPVRTAYENTCVYRSFCDASDARIKIMVKRGEIRLEGPEFTSEFSLRKLWSREKLWACVGEGSSRSDFIGYYQQNQKVVPTTESSKKESLVKFKLTWCMKIVVHQWDNAIEVVKDCLADGPVVGGFAIRTDYLDPGPYLGVGKKVKLARDDPRIPEQVEDPVPLTQLSDGDNPPERRFNLAASDASNNPSLREYDGHAVCIVGYCTENGVDYFEVQESHGWKAWDEGFRKVVTTAFQVFHVPSFVRVN